MGLLRYPLFGLTLLGVWLSAGAPASLLAAAQGDLPGLNDALLGSSAESYQEMKPQLQDSIDRLALDRQIAQQIDRQITQQPTPIPIVFPSADRTRFHGLVQQAIDRNFQQKSMGDLMQAIATQFLGDPYEENLLDRSTQEKLVVTLNQFDCVLFVETVLALARGFAVQDYSETTLTQHLQEQRYRDGQVNHYSNDGANGYCDRIHYFSEWIGDNQKRGIVTDLGSHLAGIPLNKTLNFMSSHRQSYPQLVNNDANYQCIVQAEDHLNAALTTKYIPTAQISDRYHELQPGDIIAIATAVTGLDVTHTGLVYRTETENIGLIHAAPNRGVIIARDLQTYVENVEDAIGILVARPVDPRQQ